MCPFSHLLVIMLEWGDTEDLHDLLKFRKLQSRRDQGRLEDKRRSERRKEGVGWTGWRGKKKGWMLYSRSSQVPQRWPPTSMTLSSRAMSACGAGNWGWVVIKLILVHLMEAWSNVGSLVWSLILQFQDCLFSFFFFQFVFCSIHYFDLFQSFLVLVFIVILVFKKNGVGFTLNQEISSKFEWLQWNNK